MDCCRICFTTFLKLEILGETQEKQFLAKLFTREGINEQLDGCYLICCQCKCLLKKSCKFIEKTLKAQRTYLILQCDKNGHTDSWRNLVNNELVLHSTLSYHKAEITLFLQEDENPLHEEEIKCSDFLNNTDNGAGDFTVNKSDSVDALINNDLPDNDDFETGIDISNEEIAVKMEIFKSENDEQYAKNYDDITFDDEEHESQTMTANSSGKGNPNPIKTGGNKKNPKNTNKFSDDNNKVEYNCKERTPRQKKSFYYYAHEEDDTVISNENQSVNCTELYPDVTLTVRRSMRGKKTVEEIQEATLTDRERRLIARNNVQSEDEEEISQRLKPKKSTEFNDNEELSLKERRRRMKAKKSRKSNKINTNKIKNKKNEDEDEDFTINNELSDSESDEESSDSYDDNGIKIKKPPRKYPRKCDNCDIEIATPRVHYLHYLWTHGRDMYPYRRKETATKKFVCQHCGCKKWKQSEIEEHVKIHLEKRDFLCPECGKAFCSSKSLRNHVYQVHEEKRHICYDCNKGFQSRADLIRHTRTHTGEKPFQCSICKVSYATLGNLRSHLRKGHQKLNNHNNSVSRKRNKKITKQSTFQDTNSEDSDNVSDGDNDIALEKRKKEASKEEGRTKRSEGFPATNSPMQDANDFENDIPSKVITITKKETKNKRKRVMNKSRKDKTEVKESKKHKVPAICAEFVKTSDDGESLGKGEVQNV